MKYLMVKGLTRSGKRPCTFVSLTEGESVGDAVDKILGHWEKDTQDLLSPVTIHVLGSHEPQEYTIDIEYTDEDGPSPTLVKP